MFRTRTTESRRRLGDSTMKMEYFSSGYNVNLVQSNDVECFVAGRNQWVFFPTFRLTSSSSATHTTTDLTVRFYRYVGSEERNQQRFVSTRVCDEDKIPTSPAFGSRMKRWMMWLYWKGMKKKESSCRLARTNFKYMVAD